MNYGSQQGKWAADDTCYHGNYKDCADLTGKKCEYWRGGCQAAHLPAPIAHPERIATATFPAAKTSRLPLAGWLAVYTAACLLAGALVYWRVG